MRKGLMALIVVFAGVLHGAGVAHAGSNDHSRSGFFIGFGAGIGNAGAEVAGLDPERANSFSGNFRMGWSVAPTWTMGLETSTWFKTYDVTGTNAQLSLTGTVTTFAATFYPGNMGLYLRGGVGVATGTVKIDVANNSIDETETGFGSLAAVGYEWRLTQKFALGPQLQYAFLNISGDGNDHVDFASATVQLTWFW